MGIKWMREETDEHIVVPAFTYQNMIKHITNSPIKNHY